MTLAKKKGGAQNRQGMNDLGVSSVRCSAGGRTGPKRGESRAPATTKTRGTSFVRRVEMGKSLRHRYRDGLGLVPIDQSSASTAYRRCVAAAAADVVYYVGMVSKL